MKNILLLVLPLLAMTFFSCSKGDGGDDKENTDIGGSGNGSERLVKSITTDNNMSVEIRYDNQNRIVQTKGDFNGRNMDYTIEYDDKNRTATLQGSYVNFVMIYNSNGNIAYTQPDGTTYQYSNGYISSSSSEESLFGGKINYTWLDGKIIKVSFVESEVTGDWTMDYNNIGNKLNINFPFGYGFTWDLYFINKAKGASPQYYPTIIKYFSRRTAEGYTATYQYFFDSDGFPTKIIENTYRNADKVSFSSTYTFTYY